MFADRARPIVDLLQKDLHKVGLAHCKVPHLLKMLLRFVQGLWRLQSLGEALGRLALVRQLLVPLEQLLQLPGVEDR